jgi:putative lipoprotein
MLVGSKSEKKGRAMSRTATLVAGPLAIVLCACQPFGPDSETVAGVLTYRERIALPPEAVAVISVVDLSGADSQNSLLGRTEIVGPGNPPIPFEVRYQPAAVNPERPYGVRAQIAVQRELWFMTDRPYPVLTLGAPSDTEIMLVRPSPEPVE